MNLGNFKEVLKKQYPIIDDDIISRLLFCHYKLVGKDAKEKAVYNTADDKSLLGKVQMEVGDYTLMF